MQDHLCDKHSTKFSNALIVMPGGEKSDQKLASIYQTTELPKKYQFASTRLNEAQINFMDPTLDTQQTEFDPH